jgi:hypothetical protein
MGEHTMPLWNNAWLKEYIFNLLLQPFHLLLYTILVSSAYELAGQNALYAIVAVGFMTPAEKLLRRFFGFDKAQTPGLLGGAAGAALAMTGMQSLMKTGAKGGSKSSGGEKDEDDQSKIKFSSSGGVNANSVVAGETFEGEGGSPDTQVGTPDTQEPFKGQQNIKTQNVNEGKDSSSDDSSGGTGTQGTGVKNSASLSSADSNVGNGYGRSLNLGQGNPMTGSNSSRVNSNKKKRTALGRGLRTIGAGVGAYGRGLGNKAYKRIKKGRPIRALARGIAGAYGATLFGMAGLALGIASGDPSKAFQYTTAGVVGGIGVGKGVAGKTVDALTVDSSKIQDEMEMEYYGEDYKKIKLQEEKEEMKRNEEYINYLRKTLGVSRQEAKQILDTTGDECFDSGIRNVEDIATIEEMSQEMATEEVNEWINVNEEELNSFNKKEREERIEQIRQQAAEDARKHAMAMKKFSDRTPDLSKLGDKKRESHRRQFKAEMKKEFYNRLRTQGKTPEEADQTAERLADEASKSIINGVIRFDDTKSKILEA